MLAPTMRTPSGQAATDTRMRGVIVRRLAAVVAGALACLSLTAQAHADVRTGEIGQYGESGVTCYVNLAYPTYNRVIVQAPTMSSSPVAANDTFFVGGGLYGGGNHVQRVGYRAYLYRWNGASWAYTGRYGALRTGQTADVLQPVGWFDGSGGSTWFSTPGHGYYRVAIRYYWFADSLSAGGTVTGWAHIYEEGRARYCAF